ncbi:hypothetical protein V5799_032551 [Amblyomma americanum]|uniref:Uncharacterized protein n=1 Tax=Amblyomma americanum TaxID=6943 RepID=A0AAQ4DQV2_AMBAM
MTDDETATVATGTQSDFDDDTYPTSTPRGLTTPLTDPGPVIVVPVSAPETTPGATTTASTVTTTTTPPTTRTTTTTPATTTATPTASTKSPRAAMDEQPLVCTMGSRISSARMFPPDGLCEYIFFDSVDKDNRNPLAYPHLWDSDLTIFIDAYARYSTTAFGIGFAYENVYKPDLFIAQGHYFYGDNTFRNCRVMPPTVLTMPDGLNDTYQNDLICTSSSFRQRQYSQTFDAILTRHNTDNVLFAYDNEMGLCRKDASCLICMSTDTLGYYPAPYAQAYDQSGQALYDYTAASAQLLTARPPGGYGGDKEDHYGEDDGGVYGGDDEYQYREDDDGGGYGGNDEYQYREDDDRSDYGGDEDDEGDCDDGAIFDNNDIASDEGEGPRCRRLPPRRQRRPCRPG